MGEATTTPKMDYFRMPRPLWRKLKKYLPKPRKRVSAKGGRPRASERAVADAIWYVLWTGCQWKALHRDWFGVSASVVHERFQRWRGRVYSRSSGGGWSSTMPGSAAGSAGSGRRWTPSTPQLLWEARKWATIPPTGANSGRRSTSSSMSAVLLCRWCSPELIVTTQGLRRRLDCFGSTKASRSQGTAFMCRQSLRLRGVEGVRCFGRLHRSHQGQYQNERG